MSHTKANDLYEKPTNLSALGQLVAKLSESQPQLWCLIGPDGKCYIGADPIVLAAQATYKPPSFGEQP